MQKSDRSSIASLISLRLRNSSVSELDDTHAHGYTRLHTANDEEPTTDIRNSLAVFKHVGSDMKYSMTEIGHTERMSRKINKQDLSGFTSLHELHKYSGSCGVQSAQRYI